MLGDADRLRPEDLPEAVVEAGGQSASRAAGPVAPYHEAVVRLKEELLLGAIEQANGNITKAAERLGIHPNYLHRLIRNLGLRSPPFQPRRDLIKLEADRLVVSIRSARPALSNYLPDRISPLF